MKKIVLLIALFAVIGIQTASAQIAWGARVGLCYSTVSADGESISGKPSIEFGPTAYYKLNERFYLNSGLMFSVKNFDQEYEDYGTDKLRAYFLEVPVYAGYAFSAGKTTFYAQAGPYLGIKVGEKNNFEDYGENQEDFFKSINAGLGAAVGVNIKKFKIELGYQYGLVKHCDATIGSLFTGVSYVF